MEITASELPLYLWELEQTGETGLLMIFIGQAVATIGFNEGNLVHFLFQGKSNQAAITTFCEYVAENEGQLRLKFRKGDVDNQYIKYESGSNVLAEFLSNRWDSQSKPQPENFVDRRHTVALDDEMKLILRDIALMFFGSDGIEISDSIISRTRTLRTAILFLTSEAKDEEHAQAIIAEVRARLTLSRG